MYSHLVFGFWTKINKSLLVACLICEVLYNLLHICNHQTLQINETRLQSFDHLITFTPAKNTDESN